MGGWFFFVVFERKWRTNQRPNNPLPACVGGWVMHLGGVAYVPTKQVLAGLGIINYNAKKPSSRFLFGYVGRLGGEDFNASGEPTNPSPTHPPFRAESGLLGH